MSVWFLSLKESLVQEEANRQDWEEQTMSQKDREISEANAKVKSLEESLAFERHHSAKLMAELQSRTVEFENKMNECTQKLKKQKKLHQDLTEQLTKKASSLQAALQAAEEHNKSVQSSLQKQLQDEKEMNEKIQEEAKKEKKEIDFQEMKDCFDQKTLLLKERSENKALKEERQETNTHIENLRFNLQLLVTKHSELREKVLREDENTELADQLTKQVTSHQAALQAAEEGFKKEKEELQKYFQKLKDSYDHNTQLLLKEKTKNEELRKERQEIKTYIENIQHLETELMEKVLRKEENTDKQENVFDHDLTLEKKEGTKCDVYEGAKRKGRRKWCIPMKY